MSRDKKTRGLGETATRLQEDTSESLNRLIPDWVRNGKLVENVSITPGSQVRVPHGLGHNHRGWMLVSPRSTGGASVYEVRNERDKNVVVLQATNSITVDLWIW